MRTVPVEAPELAARAARKAPRAARRAIHAVLDEMLTLVLLTGFAAVLFVEFN
jgi:hypothetical protein